MNKTENNKVGMNDKVFPVRKDGHATVKFSDVVTKDGNLIKQSALKRFLFVNAITKERETLRNFILDAIGLGYTCNGELQATITPVSARKSYDTEAIADFLTKHGANIDTFIIEGKVGQRLIVE